MTLLLYARRKGWPLEGVTSELSRERAPASDVEERDEGDQTMVDVVRHHIEVKGDLNEEQRQRLVYIARRCPIHRTLSEGPRIFDEIVVAG